MKNALIVCSTTNIGDDIQSYAVSCLMPAFDFTIDRENISSFVPDCKAVIAGWYKHDPADWPPNQAITPLFLAFHAYSKSCVEKHIDYLKLYEPIGCRDQATVDLCQSCGIDAYFSGCVTLSLVPLCVDKSTLPLFVDIEAPVGIEHNKCNILIKEKIHGARLSLARARLEHMCSAKCVVTSRLHVAMPCAAMGVPTLLIPPENDPRFTGLDGFVHTLTQWDEQAIRDFVAAPSENPRAADRLRIAASIRESVQRFYGYTPSSCNEWKIQCIKPLKEARGHFQLVESETCEGKADICAHGSMELYDPFPNQSILKDTGVVTLPMGGVLGNHGWVIDQNGHLIAELSWYNENELDDEILQKLQIRSRRRLQGRVLSLASSWSNSNYYHSLIDGIGRLSVVEAAGLALHSFDYVILPHMRVPDILHLVGKLGIAEEALIHHLNSNELLICDELIVPTLNGQARQSRRSLVKWIRNRLMPVAVYGEGRRIFIKRTGNRKIKNEEEIEEIAESYGFEIIDPIKTPMMYKVFRQADIVIGVHQAGFANIAFMRENTYFLEIIPSAHQYKFYHNLAVIANVNYHFMLARSEGHQRPYTKRKPSLENVYVDPAVFDSSLEQIIKKCEKTQV